ncbi:hypothetical protein DBR32_08700 [Taibaiella sp. KBW10]|uniref:BatA domain-containing protein n=1 Tax=Taibaiella sp. KBW10 TaxID=2153357 RepID=UPI000F5AD63E|nr:BatA domain-containing protein [Taibaiella sp. KBW10]RQO30792.1 hypothetical protein DBR32_08700 [Taibaiella sp. KBW10]
MNFLFPLFLLSGLAIAIPIIIHLFNFRKYKTVHFSDTRLLESIKVTSKKSATIQNWWLLLSRILFVLAMVLAFAQPFWKGATAQKSGIQVFYVDNSQSMAASRNSQLNLLQKAISDARKTIEQQGPAQEYILLTNDNMYASRPVTKSEALKQIEAIAISAKTVSLQQIVTAVSNATQNNNVPSADVYIFSDIQKSTLLSQAVDKPAKEFNFHFITNTHKDIANLYFDTAYFVNPTIDTRQENPLVVKIGRSGKQEQSTVAVQVLVNNQVRAAKTISFTTDSTRLDTIPLVINTPGWHQIAIVLKDEHINYDDTFRMTAKTNATLSVLNLTEAAPSPYITAALSPANGFITQQQGIAAINDKDWSRYNLIILQNIATLSPALVQSIKSGLTNGLSFFIIPKNIRDIAAFNQQLAALAPISFAAEDTSRQQVGSVQSEHALLKDVIASVPTNVQLPTVLKYYPITAGLNAGQQSILTMKNGKPLLAQYAIGQGKLYLSASALDEQSGNFVLSNLFMPILYRMCAQSGAQSIYAITANSKQPVFVPLSTANRSVFKIWGKGQESVPPQTPFGNGTNIYVGKSISQTGFYTIKGNDLNDSTLIAVNNDILESQLEPAEKATIEAALKPASVNWQDAATSIQVSSESSMPLWKWCLILALISLCIETFFLLRKKRAHSANA